MPASPRNMDWVFPPNLKPGSRVRVIAPSGPFEPALVWRGLAALRARYRVEFSRGIFQSHGYLAGDDTRRRAELQAALNDPALEAIIAARGGYGLSRITGAIDWSALRAHPKWLVGFSDITVMHLEAGRLKVASLHAHNAGGLGRYDQARHDAWFQALEAPATLEYSLRPIIPGEATGRLVGGNLTLVATQHCARRLELEAGSVLFLEEVCEAPYHIDRLLTALITSGALARISGVVLGQFTGCRPGNYGVPVEAVLRERLSLLGVPVASELPAGHEEQNHPLRLGSQVYLHVTAKNAKLASASG